MLNAKKIKTLVLFSFLLVVATGMYFYLIKPEINVSAEQASVVEEPLAEEPVVKKIKVGIKQVNYSLEKTIITAPEIRGAATMTLKKVNNPN